MAMPIFRASDTGPAKLVHLFEKASAFSSISFQFIKKIFYKIFYYDRVKVKIRNNDLRFPFQVFGNMIGKRRRKGGANRTMTLGDDLSRRVHIFHERTLIC
jgi:hypothetical protein